MNRAQTSNFMIFYLRNAKGCSAQIQSCTKILYRSLPFDTRKTWRWRLGWGGWAGSTGANSAVLRVGLLPAPSQSPQLLPSNTQRFESCLTPCPWFWSKQFPIVKVEVIAKRENSAHRGLWIFSSVNWQAQTDGFVTLFLTLDSVFQDFCEKCYFQ